MKKNVILLIIITGMTSIFGFAKSMSLAYFYGASTTADAYVIATTIPNLFFAFFGHAVKSGVIPIYNDLNEKQSQDKAYLFLNNVLGLITISLIALSISIALYSSHLVELIAPGLSGDTLLLAIRLTRVTAFSIILQGITSIFKSYLNIKNNFSTPALSILPLDIVILISIILSARYNVMFLAYGYLIGAVVQTIVLLFPLKKDNYSYQLIIDLNNQDIKKFFSLIIPILFSVVINDLNKIVDKALASQVAIGGVSALSYSSRLITFVQTTIIISVSTVAFPVFSKYFAANNLLKLKNSIVANIRLIILLIFPAILGIVFYSDEIIELLYGRGAFDDYSRNLTKVALIYYSLGMLGFGLNSIFTRYFYATQKSKIPMIGAVLSGVVNIILNFSFYNFTNLGIGGLTLSTSIATTVNSIWLGVMTRKILGKVVNKEDYLFFLKILIGSIVMIVLSKLFQQTIIYIVPNTNLTSVLSIGTSIFIYFITLMALKVNEVSDLIAQVLVKLGINK